MRRRESRWKSHFEYDFEVSGAGDDFKPAADEAADTKSTASPPTFPLEVLLARQRACVLCVR